MIFVLIRLVVSYRYKFKNGKSPKCSESFENIFATFVEVTKYMKTVILASGRGGCGLWILSGAVFCALTDCPKILTLQSRQVSGPGKLEIIKKACRSSEIQPRKVGGIGFFGDFLPMKITQNPQDIPLYPV